ncbi:hypothetical protein LTR17_000769 [Elasticomyces elasticus]|nr:hypothetical protein LTR17_000769 [Elasticomyces elasticus]
MAPPKLGKHDRDALRAYLQQHGADANTMWAGMNALNIPRALRKASEAQVAWVIAHPTPAPAPAPALSAPAADPAAAQGIKSASPEPVATPGVASWQDIAGMIGDLRETIASDQRTNLRHDNSPGSPPKTARRSGLTEDGPSAENRGR